MLQVWAAALLLAALCCTPQGCEQQRDLTGVQGASLIRNSDSSSGSSSGGSGSGRSDRSSSAGGVGNGDSTASAVGGSRSRGRSAAAAAVTDQQSKVCVMICIF